MKRLLALMAIVLVAGALVGLLARVWHPAPPAPAPQVAAPVAELLLTITRTRVAPELATIGKGHRVQLRVTNHDPHAVTLSLSGYDDRFHTGPIAPDSTWSGEFLADRPGEGFTWLVDGAPLGRLDITGSHLEEGHR